MNTSALLHGIDTEVTALWQDRLYWVPIRHHSPACAYALRNLLFEVQPDVVLIEGPEDCQSLIPYCQHSETQAPVAFLTQKGQKQDLYTAFFPLCDYSPELVAIRTAAQLNTPIKLIDLPYEARDNTLRDEKVQSLMEESYLSHSRYLQAITKQLGCRDQHESWDRLFEQRSLPELRNWRSFFRDVYAYCALARRDYDEAVLKANGDYAREAFMASNIKTALSEYKGTCVVVTGGFHTPALALGLDSLAKGLDKKTKQNSEDRNWIIRYSYDQLDALNGYTAGMPAPAYYQLIWQAMQQDKENYLQDCATAQLINIAHDNRKQKLTGIISTSEVQSAIFHARQLANLRQCAGPGRSEILDAVLSCYVKDSADRKLRVLADARRVMCGDTLGAIPADSRQPPLVMETWKRGQQLGLDFTRTQVKDVELEIYKKPKHREISRYFHLLQFCEISLASWQAGPDFVSDSQTERLREHWAYAWTPSVESQLLDKITLGTTLEVIALRKITEQEDILADSGSESRAQTAASLLLRACVMGMHDYVAHIAEQISRLIHDDEHITSLIGCGFHLITLKNGQTVLEPSKLGIPLEPLIQQCWCNALYLLPRLEELNDANGDIGVQALQDLYAYSRQVDCEVDDFYRSLLFLVDSSSAVGTIRGAALGILFQSGQLPQPELEHYLSRFMQQNQQPELVLGIIYGLICSAREVLWRIPSVLQHINRMLLTWSEEYFLHMLPSLRRLFSQLMPKEIDKVATELVRLNQLTTSPGALYNTKSIFSESELALIKTLDDFVERTLQQADLPLLETSDERS